MTGYRLIQFSGFFMIRAAAPGVFILAPLSVFVYMILMFSPGIVSMIFSLIGSIKADYGDVWSYPSSIKVFKEK